MTKLHNHPAHEGKESMFRTALRTVKAVMWSFVGLRSRSGYEQDVVQLNPVHIIVVGLVGVFIFVGSLILLATWVVAK